MGLGNFYYPLYPAICIIGCVLMLLPLPWHIRARNTGTLMYFFWSFGANLQAAINHIVWSGFLHNKYPLWCDISAKFQVGVTAGIGAAILVVNRRLYKIANISTVLVSAKQKRRDLFIDLGIGLGLPLLVMVLHVIVQGHRYNIIEGMGCQQTTYHTPPAYFLVWLWPPVISLVSAVYVILALRLFLKRRNSFDEFLNSNNSGLNVDRYLRLMLFSAFELIVSLPLNVYMILEQAINHQIFPWISWEDTHWGFNRADLIPFFFIRRSRTLWISYNVYIWVIPFTAFCFFGFFGFGKEQRKNYVKAFWLIMSYVGIKRPEPTPYNSGRPLPWWKRMLGFKSSSVNTAGTGLSSATDSLPRFAKAGVVSHTSNPISSLDKPTRRVRRDSMDSLDAELDRMAQRDNQLLDEKAITKKFNPSASSSSSVDYNDKDDGGSSCGSSVDESHDRVVRAVPEPRAPPRALDPRDIV